MIVTTEPIFNSSVNGPGFQLEITLAPQELRSKSLCMYDKAIELFGFEVGMMWSC